MDQPEVVMSNPGSTECTSLTKSLRESLQRWPQVASGKWTAGRKVIKTATF